MAIPKNIHKEHLQKAIEKIDKEGIPNDGASQYYDVIYNNKSYPPKVVVSYANIFANGHELNRNTFSGGLETECFRLLEENGFVIQKKSIAYYLLGAAWYGSEDDPDQTERFIENGIWENSNEDRFIDIVKGVNVGDKVAIKSSYATKDRKSILRIKATGTVSENKGDGRILKINWDKRFEPFDLEGFGGYRNTIQKVAEEDIDAIFKSTNKMSYYQELKKFLDQSKTTALGTMGYLNNFKGLSVKISFGKGNQARVPWIAFLNEDNNVQNGIYPVYLYYKEKDLLILAYGVSETNKPDRKWNITNEKTIEEYFNINSLGKPDRYENSLVFKAYNTNLQMNEREIDSDLNELITIYKNSKHEFTRPKIEFQAEAFDNVVNNAGLLVTTRIQTRFISSLLTKPFVILTGLSGSGKTKLAQAFAMWICEDNSQYCIVPVGADWTNREPLLGFPNALKAKEYVKPDNSVLDLIINATQNTDKPYFLILDEMNLSHVERYFADFLSVMESKGKIALHPGPEDWNNVPSQIIFPKNLFIIGTVNIDETTYMFSPKVLDRASVIEFSVTANEMSEYLSSNANIDLDALEANGKDMAHDFVAIAKNDDLQVSDASTLSTTLLNFFSELKKTGAEFGYRSANEILRFAAVIEKLRVGWSIEEIADAAIMQKLLPKVHGSRRKLEPVLKTLGALCLNDNKEIETLIVKTQIETNDDVRIKYPISFEKIQRMYQNLLSNGFTSYAEA